MDSHYLDELLFVVLPYLALAIFFLVTIQRYRMQSFSYSSLSSQFLENRHHFWGLVPFHYGILVVLAAHLVAFLLPRQVLWWNSQPFRLYLLEAALLVFGLLTLVGLVSAIVRRLGDARLREVTSVADWLVYALLLVQVSSGVLMAVLYPWGSSWFAASLAPYLWSIVRLNPDPSYLAGMPHLIKLHVVNAALLIGFFPFTRLVHILVVPNPYLWRRAQVVRWYRERRSAAAAEGH
jgi:nitrate reductase gamma subunit